MNKKKNQEKRPAIPPLVKNELWIKAGARCEFRGCNKYLLEDGLTMRKMNGAHIAHIISWTPTGPRGDIISSAKLAKDINNLMLLCPIHNHLIDDNDYVNEYPVDLLLQYKKDHEERIKRLTSLGEDYKIKIVKIFSRIQGQNVGISDDDIQRAIIPFYPDDNSIQINLISIENIEEAKRYIRQQVELHFSPDTNKAENIAIFAMAKIPYVCYLGYCLGDKIRAICFQKFRDTQDWIWKSQNFDGRLDIITPSENLEAKNVNLLIEISGEINKSLIDKNTYPCYEIIANEPSVNFLKTKDQIIEFKVKFQDVIHKIAKESGEDCVVHLYVAIPNSISFEIGRSIMKNIDPTIILYDKVDDNTKYQEILVLHERIRTNLI